MNTKAGLSVFKNLLQINKNRIKVYKVAHKDTQYKDLKGKFMKYIATSKKHKSQLVQIIRDLNSSIAIRNTFKVSFFILYMKINLLFSNYGRKTILDFCSYWEDTVKKGYQYALNKKNSGKISLPNHKIMIAQQTQISLEQADVSLLRDTSV